jgi:hypothetical protein
MPALNAFYPCWPQAAPGYNYLKRLKQGQESLLMASQGDKEKGPDDSHRDLADYFNV